MSVDPGAITGPNVAKLMLYSWPGNARERRNVLARSVVFINSPTILLTRSAAYKHAALGWAGGCV